MLPSILSGATTPRGKVPTPLRPEALQLPAVAFSLGTTHAEGAAADAVSLPLIPRVQKTENKGERHSASPTAARVSFASKSDMIGDKDHDAFSIEDGDGEDTFSLMQSLLTSDQLDSFAERLMDVEQLSTLLTLQSQLQKRLSKCNSKMELLKSYYVKPAKNSKHADAIPEVADPAAPPTSIFLTEKQSRHLNELADEIEMLCAKLSMILPHISELEAFEAEKRAKALVQSKGSEKRLSEAQSVKQKRDQQLRQTTADVFDSVLRYPLKPEDIHTRLKNELILPWILRICSHSNSVVKNIKAMAQWVLYELLDEVSMEEFLHRVPEAHLLRTGILLIEVFRYTTVALKPSVRSSLPLREVPVTSLPDFTRIALDAVSHGDMDTLSLIIHSGVRLDKALKDREMVAILLFAAAISGRVDTLHKLMQLGFYHSHLIHALLFLSKNTTALLLERHATVRIAALCDSIQMQHVAMVLRDELLELQHHQHHVGHSQLAKSHRDHEALASTPKGQSAVATTVSEDPCDDNVDVDELLASWEANHETTSSAGGYISLDKSLSSRSPTKPSRQPVSFTQLARAGRFSRLRQSLHVQAIPYFATESIQRFGDKAFASTNAEYHVAVRGDTPIPLPPPPKGSRVAGGGLRVNTGAQAPYRIGPSVWYYEVHVSLDAIASGEDCVHIGWCSENFAADGIQHAVVGNDAHSLGISLVAADTAHKAIHGSAVQRSAASALGDGMASVLSLRAKSRLSGFSSRFSTRGEVVSIPLKHHRGHSQRQFPDPSLCVLMSVGDEVENAELQASWAMAQLGEIDADVPEVTPGSRCDEVSNVTAATLEFGTLATSSDRIPSDTLSKLLSQSTSASQAPVLITPGSYSARKAPVPLTDSNQEASGRRDSAINETYDPRTGELHDRIIGSVVVVGCLLDISAKMTTFFINGVSLGASFDEFPQDATQLYPCASLVRFRQDVSSPTIRFCFEQSELRYLPRESTGEASNSPESSVRREAVDHFSSWSAADKSDDDLIRHIVVPEHTLRLFDIEAKISHIITLCTLPDTQCGLFVQHHGGRRPSSVSLDEESNRPEPTSPLSPSCPTESVENVASLDRFAKRKVSLNSTIFGSADSDEANVITDVAVKCLNKPCLDRRMYFMPLALINETIELGAEHQELDTAVLCCAANPTPLLYALFQRRRVVASQLASNPHVDVEARDAFGVTPLLVASALGYADVVKIILKRCSPDLVLSKFHGYTPLHSAIMAEHDACVTEILDYGATAFEDSPEKRKELINAYTPRGNTPLLIACKLHALKLVEILLKHGADATLVERRNHHTPLLIACHDDCTSIAKALLASGQYNNHPSINTPSKDNLGVPLCWAAQNGMTSLVPAFCAAGADPAVPFADAQPLISAIACGHEDTALALIHEFLGHLEPSKVRHDFFSRSGLLPVDDEEDDGLRQLQKKLSTSPSHFRLDVHAVDPRTQSTALHLACEMDSTRVVEALLSYGALICSPNKQFATPLHVAITHGHEELALHLVKEGKAMVQQGIAAFDITLMDTKGDTVLHAACRSGMLDVVKAIVHQFSTQEIELIVSRTRNRRLKALDLCAENRQGDTPLVCAIKAGHEDTVEWIVSATDPMVDLCPKVTANNAVAVVECLDAGMVKSARLLINRGAVVTADVRHEVFKKWEQLTSEAHGPGAHRGAGGASESLNRKGTTLSRSNLTVSGRRTSISADLESLIHEDETPFLMAEPSRVSINKSPKGLVTARTFSDKKHAVSHRVASRLAEGKKLTSRAPVRRRSTVQRMFRPVAARFDDSVASKLLRMYHVDELLFEFESIMGFCSLTAPEILDHGDVVVSSLLAHGGVCFSSSESVTLAKAGYSVLNSKPHSTPNISTRREIARRLDPFGAVVFSTIRRYGPKQGLTAVQELSKAYESFRSQEDIRRQKASTLEADGSPPPYVTEAMLTNPYSGVSALQLASFLGLTDVVRFLFHEVGVNPAYRGTASFDGTIWNPSVTELFPLRVALLAKQMDVIDVLVHTTGARNTLDLLEPASRWPSRATLLHSAASIPLPGVVQSLLEAGAGWEGCTSDGDDVWLLAARESTGAVMDVLLHHGANPSSSFLSAVPVDWVDVVTTSTLIEKSESRAEFVAFRDAIHHSTGRPETYERTSTVTFSREPSMLSLVSDAAQTLKKRNLIFFRRWFASPFLDDAAFEDPVTETTGTSDGEQSMSRSVCVVHGRMSYRMAYLSALLFTCVQHLPSRVLDLMRAASIELHVSHPVTEDSLLTFVIGEALNASEESDSRKDIVSLAQSIVQNFSSQLNLATIRADGETALSLAAKVGDVDLIAALIKNGAPILMGKSNPTMTFNRAKVVVWRQLAQLYYPLEREDLLTTVLKSLEPNVPTRRAFLTAALPNLHPLIIARLACSAPQDVYAACTVGSPAPALLEASTATWAAILYVVGFLPESLRSSYYLPKRLVDALILPLASTAPPIVVVALHQLRNRQRFIREQNAALHAARRVSYVRRMSTNLSPMQVAQAGSTAPQLPANRISPNVTAPTALLAVPGDATRRGSRRSSATVFLDPLSQQPAPTFAQVAAHLMEQLHEQPSNTPSAAGPPLLPDPDRTSGSPADTSATCSDGEGGAVPPLHLLSTPPGLALVLPGEGDEQEDTIRDINLTPFGTAAAVSTSPTPQRGLSVEVLHFKISEHLANMLRESGVPSFLGAAAEMNALQGISPSNPSTGDASGGESSSTDVNPNFERMFDAIEICLRRDLKDALSAIRSWIPSVVKFSAIVRERRLLCVVCCAGNVDAVESLILNHVDAMTMDEVDTATQCPAGITPNTLLHGTQFQRDLLLAPFQSLKSALPSGAPHETSTSNPGSSRGGHRERAAGALPFNFSADSQARLQGRLSLSRRMSYDAAAAAARAAANAGPTGSVPATLPGTIPPATQTRKKLQQKNVVHETPSDNLQVTIPPKMYCCLYDWAIHSFHFLRRKAPSKACLETILTLFNKRCPLSYPFLQFLSYSTEEGAVRTHASDPQHASAWRSTDGAPVGVNSLSDGNRDSWLHIMVMHNQVLLVDYFLTVNKGKFAHRAARNKAGLMPVDYCASYAMASVLASHNCLNLGIGASVALSTRRGSNRRRIATSVSEGAGSNVPQLLVVPREFIHIFDADNSKIEKRLEIPPHIRALYGIDRSDEVSEPEGVENVPSPHGKQKRLQSIPRPPNTSRTHHTASRTTATVPDDVILRNQRITQRFLHEVYFPIALRLKSDHDDRLLLSPSPVGSNAVSPSAQDAAAGRMFPTTPPSLTVPSPTAEALLSNKPQVARAPPLPVSIQIMRNASLQARMMAVESAFLGNAAQHSVSVKSPLGMSPRGAAGRRHSPQPPKNSRLPQVAKAKTITEFVELLRQNLFLVQVDEIVKVAASSVSATDSTAAGKALFVAFPLFLLAVKNGAIRLQNHRVASYDQLDSAMSGISIGAVSFSERMKHLESHFYETGATQTVSSLGLELAPRYASLGK